MSNPVRDFSLLTQEVNELRQRVEDQFHTQQTLQRRFILFFEEQGIDVKPTVIDEAVPPLIGRPRKCEPLCAGIKHQANALGEQWWPTGRTEPQPLIPQTGWSNYTMRPKSTKALGISTCGMSRKKRRHIVEMIARRQARDRDFRPVFLTDSLDFSVLISFGFTVEYMRPKPETPSSAWTRYATARHEFVIQKWGLQEIIQFGPTPFGP